MRLKGKRAIVTGGGSGIGNAICNRFLREGADVLVADISQQSNDSSLGEYFYNTDKLSPGLYIAELKSDNNSKIIKLLKSK